MGREPSWPFSFGTISYWWGNRLGCLLTSASEDACATGQLALSRYVHFLPPGQDVLQRFHHALRVQPGEIHQLIRVAA